MTKYRMIQVGCGGFGAAWCGKFLPQFAEEGRIEIVAAVDIDTAALAAAREPLGLREDQLYTDFRAAFAAHPADFCTVVVPPAVHRPVVEAAVEHGLHILSEKPLADNAEASRAIARVVRSAGVKFGMTMSHRYERDKTSLRELLRAGELGPLDYLVDRIHWDCRKFGAWGEFRHRIADTLMIEDGIHQFDLLANLARSKCEWVHAETWTPDWGEFDGHAEALVTLRFANGARALYEGSMTAAVGLAPWSHQYLRAECRDGITVLYQQRLERFLRDSAGEPYQSGVEGKGEEKPLLEQPRWGHAWLIEQFLDWLDGGSPMETDLDNAVHSMAIVLAAMQSTHEGRRVNVADIEQTLS